MDNHKENIVKIHNDNNYTNNAMSSISQENQTTAVQNSPKYYYQKNFSTFLYVEKFHLEQLSIDWDTLINIFSNMDEEIKRRENKKLNNQDKLIKKEIDETMNMIKNAIKECVNNIEKNDENLPFNMMKLFEITKSFYAIITVFEKCDDDVSLLSLTVLKQAKVIVCRMIESIKSIGKKIDEKIKMKQDLTNKNIMMEQEIKNVENNNENGNMKMDIDNVIVEDEDNHEKDNSSGVINGKKIENSEETNLQCGIDNKKDNLVTNKKVKESDKETYSNIVKKPSNKNFKLNIFSIKL